MRKLNSFITDAVIYRTAELFLNADQKVDAISKQLNEEFPRAHLKRQSIYLLLAKAKEKGLVRLVPPLNTSREKKLIEKFGVKTFRSEEDELSPVTVVDCPIAVSSDTVSVATAEIVLNIIRKLGKCGKTSVGLGIGPGRATLEFSRSLSALIRDDASLPKLTLVGISAGCRANRPQFSSTSFFNFFPPERLDKCIGLFAQPLVLSKEFGALKVAPEVKDAFDAKDEIDVVVTSMGNMADPHTFFRELLNRPFPPRNKKPEWLHRCVGDVQYRPFSKDGPIHEKPDEFRLVTIFELEELVDMASRKGKYVILIARQCGACASEGKLQAPRAMALLPLLTNAKLRLFSHLVVDSPTADELLAC